MARAPCPSICGVGRVVQAGGWILGQAAKRCSGNEKRTKMNEMHMGSIQYMRQAGVSTRSLRFNNTHEMRLTARLSCTCMRPGEQRNKDTAKREANLPVLVQVTGQLAESSGRTSVSPKRNPSVRKKQRIPPSWCPVILSSDVTNPARSEQLCC